MKAQRKLVVVISRGLDDERSSVAWSIANGGIKNGLDVSVFLVSSGVDWVRKGAADRAHLNPEDPTMIDMIKSAIDAGCHEHGASVHVVTATVDGGPVIAQARVPVLADDTATTLAERVLLQEHRLYPLVIGWYAQQRLGLAPDGRILFDGKSLDEPRQLEYCSEPSC